MDNFSKLGHLASLLKYGIRSGSWQGSLTGPVIQKKKKKNMGAWEQRVPLPGEWERLLDLGLYCVRLGPLIENIRMGLGVYLGGMAVQQGWDSGFQ